MQTYDLAQAAMLLWRAVDSDAGAMSMAESVEQLQERNIRLKPAKAGARTVSLPATIIQELHAHRIALGQNMLLLGRRLDGEDFICLHADGRSWSRLDYARRDQDETKLYLPAIRFHDLRHAHATHTLADVFIRRSQASGSVTLRLASRSISTRMLCRGCKKKQSLASMPRCEHLCGGSNDQQFYPIHCFVSSKIVGGGTYTIATFAGRVPPRGRSDRRQERHEMDDLRC